MTTIGIQSAIQFALHGLSDRRTVTDNNLANVQTPGFLAKRSSFEDALKSALEGNSVSLKPTQSTSLSPTRTDGNNVDIDNETVTAIDTNLRYQAMVEAMNHQFRTLRSAIGSQ